MRKPSSAVLPDSIFTPLWIVFGGFSGLACDEETSLLLSVIAPAGVLKTKKAPFGPRQGPAIYQSVQEHIFGSAFKQDGSPSVDILVISLH